MSHPIVRCASCGQFCTSKSIRTGNDVQLCEHCQQFRITKEASNTIIQFIQSFYSATPIGSIKSWKLIMISPDALFWKTKEKATRGLAEACGNEYTIYIYRELSRVSFARTLAHEMLHIYQYQHKYRPEKSICEGFCNMGAYLILKQIGNAEAQANISNMLEDPDPIYGDGFRYMKNIYDLHGWNGLIKEIARKT